MVNQPLQRERGEQRAPADTSLTSVPAPTSSTELEATAVYWHTTNYLAAAQIYLKENVLDMSVRNGTSRLHLLMQVIRLAAAWNLQVAARAGERAHHYECLLADHHRYIEEHRSDPEEIAMWQWDC